jgi:hypothetical protein
MEDILDVYHRPFDPYNPVVCMDEQPTQLIGETRMPIPAAPGKPLQYDFEYERNGTAVNFMFTEPLGGWRKVTIREHRTKIDWAQEIKQLLDEEDPKAHKVVLVCDNLNTHKIASSMKPLSRRKRGAWHSDLKFTIRRNTAVGLILQRLNSVC